MSLENQAKGAFDPQEKLSKAELAREVGMQGPGEEAGQRIHRIEGLCKSGVSRQDVERAFPDVRIRRIPTPEEIDRRRKGHMEYFRKAHRERYGQLMEHLTEGERTSLQVEFGEAGYVFETYPAKRPGWVALSFVRDGVRRTVRQGCIWREGGDNGPRHYEQAERFLPTPVAPERPREAGTAPDRETAYSWALDRAIDRIEDEEFDHDARLSDIPPEPPVVPPTPEERRQEVLGRYPGMQKELIAALPGRDEKERREIYETLEISVGPVIYTGERRLIDRVYRPGEPMRETHEVRMTFRKGSWRYTTVTSYEHESEWQDNVEQQLLYKVRVDRRRRGGGTDRSGDRGRKRQLETMEKRNRQREEGALRHAIRRIDRAQYTSIERVERGRSRGR